MRRGNIAAASEGLAPSRYVSHLLSLCLCGAVAVMLLLASTPASGQELKVKGPLEFESHRITLPGRVALSYYEDIDRDGLVDILAVHAGEDLREPPRNLVVFFQTDAGVSEQPDLWYRVPDDVALIDLGNVIAENEGQELLLLHADGVDWLALPRPDASGQTIWLSGHGTPLVRMQSLFAQANPEQLGKRDFAEPIEEAGEATLFLPCTDGYTLYFPQDGYAQGDVIPVKHMHRVSDDSYGVITAELHLGDADGDGHDDLITAHRDEIRFHYQKDGRFPAVPDYAIRLQILTDADFESTREREHHEGVDRLIGTNVDDFDGDGLVDLFVWKQIIQKKAVVNDKQQYQVFLNKAGSFEVIPDQAFVLKSFDSPKILDLDGDGRPDMITGYFEFSVGNLIKALITKRFVIELDFFLYDDGGYPDQPDETRDIKIRFSLSNMDENFTPAVEIEGDFDGDDRVDFLLQTEDEKVVIFLGTMGEGRLFEKKPSIEIETPASEWAHVEDFNGDGLADVVFDRFPNREPFDEGWIIVVMSRPPPAR